MKILYDDLGFREPVGGVSRYFTELIKHLPIETQWKIAAPGTYNAYLKEPPFSIQASSRSFRDFLPGVNFRGKSAVADIPALAKGAAVVVGNDTGPSHIAYYAGARLVMVFTDFDFGRAAHPDSPRVASLHGAAITDISTEAVWDALGKVMDHD